MNRKAQTHLIDALNVFAALLTDAYGQSEADEGSSITIYPGGTITVCGAEGEVILNNVQPDQVVFRLITDQPENSPKADTNDR